MDWDDGLLWGAARACTGIGFRRGRGSKSMHRHWLQEARAARVCTGIGFRRLGQLEHAQASASGRAGAARACSG